MWISRIFILPIIFVLSVIPYSFANIIGPAANLYVGNKVISPDGFNRSAVLAGSTSSKLTFPGPVIIGTKGSTFRINVIDQLTDTTMLRSTSIHWHGLFQRRSNWADGVVGVTQCPIAPGDSFVYQFSATDQAGTFWYHSHYSTQYCDGLRGVMVVQDPLDPHKSKYQVDDESTIITLADWYHIPAPSLLRVPAPDATLINGKGRYAGGPTSELAIIRVQQHVRYRFRLVSLSCNPNYVFSIDGHTMQIIEVDGNNVEPVNVDSIQIYAGQRYSFVLEANQTIGNYWVRAQPNAGTLGFDGGINSAILRYIGAPDVDPNTTQTPSTIPLLETSLHPLINAGAPGGANPPDMAINLVIGQNSTTFRATINGVSFQPPVVPVLLQIMSGAMSPEALLPPGSVYVLPPNKVIEVSVPGGSVGSPHSMHLHGHAFDVVRSAGSSTYNYVNPVRRDVVAAGFAGDNITIRFRTDNPGPWIFHCHNDWHLEAGMAVVFAEDVATVHDENVPHAWESLCPTYNALPPEEL
ncbi:laccase 2 [Cyathus striatus]|nr:laccase 2 [Cyathus striatus]